jgi:hypothetical protein
MLMPLVSWVSGKATAARQEYYGPGGSPGYMVHGGHHGMMKTWPIIKVFPYLVSLCFLLQYWESNPRV